MLDSFSSWEARLAGVYQERATWLLCNPPKGEALLWSLAILAMLRDILTHAAQEGADQQQWLRAVGDGS